MGVGQLADVFIDAVAPHSAGKGDYSKTMPVEHAEEVLDAFEAGHTSIFAAKIAAEISDQNWNDPEVHEAQVIERFYTNPIPVDEADYAND